jgi:hypothetical protein
VAQRVLQKSFACRSSSLDQHGSCHVATFRWRRISAMAGLAQPRDFANAGSQGVARCAPACETQVVVGGFGKRRAGNRKISPSPSQAMPTTRMSLRSLLGRFALSELSLPDCCLQSTSSDNREICASRHGGCRRRSTADGGDPPPHSARPFKPIAAGPFRSPPAAQCCDPITHAIFLRAVETHDDFFMTTPVSHERPVLRLKRSPQTILTSEPRMTSRSSLSR